MTNKYNKEELFNQLCINAGYRGALNLASIDGSALYKFIDSYLKHCEQMVQGMRTSVFTRPGIPEIFIGIVDSGELNAFAGRIPDIEIDFIGITWGTVVIVLKLFATILSHPNAFPLIGETGVENEIRAKLHKLPTCVEEIGHPDSVMAISQLPLGRPIDLIRAGVAWELSRIALDFIFSHELAHVRYAHRVTRGLSGLQLIMEVQPNQNLSGFMVNQAIELDADAYASVRIVDQNIAWTKVDTQNPALRELYFDYGTSFYYSLYSIYILFRTFGMAQGHKDSLENSPYHPPAFRFSYIATAMFELAMINRIPVPSNIVGPAFLSAVGDAEAILAQIITSYEAPYGLTDACSGVGGEHLGKIRSAYSTIAPLLKQYSFATDVVTY